MTEFAEIRRKLESRLHELEERVDRIQGHLRKPGHPDFAERATEAENDEVLEALDEAEGRELEQVRHALRRLEHGSYGRCARCEEPIAPGRLEALPFATTCIDCAD